MKYPILLIEDSDEDYTVMVRALREMPVEITLTRCRQSDEALEYLYRRGVHADAPRPSLILLDLNLPGIDGRELLTRLKQDEELKLIPVIVITTSANPRDVLTCYQQGVNSYHVKAVNYLAFKEEMQRMIRYWLTDCLIPARLEEKS